MKRNNNFSSRFGHRPTMGIFSQKLATSWWFLAAVCLTMFVDPAGGQDICACAPSTYEFTFDFGLTCPPINVTRDGGVAATYCQIFPFGDPEQNITDTVPVAVDYVDILELGQDFTVVVQENVTGGFLNGESFSYTSVIARDNGGEVEIPRVLQLNIFGINALDQPIVNFFAIAYSNNCLTFPVLEEGNSAGWTRFTQLENPSKEFCPAAPEPAVTDPPLTPAPTTAPLPDTPAPTPTPATGAPTPAPVDPVTEAPVDPATDAPVEPPTEPPVDAPTEPPVDPPTEPPVDAPTEPPVEPPTEPPVDAPTEPPVEPPTEPPVDAPTDPPVVAPIPKPPTDIDLSMSMFVSTDYMSMGFMSMSMGYDGDLDSLMAAMGKKGKKKKGDEPMSMSMGYDEDLDSLMAAMEFGRSSAPAKKGKKKGDARRLRLSRPYVEV